MSYRELMYPYSSIFAAYDHAHNARIDDDRYNQTVRVVGMSSTEPTLSQQFVSVEWMDRELGVPLAQLDPVEVDDETKQAIEDWHYWLER